MAQRLIIKGCLKLIEEKSCLGDPSKWVQRDYAKLSALIEEETNISLSVSTLRRIWNIKSSFQPQKSTLDALARYSGYKDWYDYSSQQENLTEGSNIHTNQLFQLFKKVWDIPRKILIPYFIIILLCLSVYLITNKRNTDNARIFSTISKEDINTETPKMVVDSLLRSISFYKNTKPEPEVIRDLFLEDALITLRYTDNVMGSYNVNGFIESIVQFSKGEKSQLFGYHAYANKVWEFEYGDIAHVYVHYQGKLSGFEDLLSNGFDSFHLVRTTEGWKISSIIGESYNENSSLPHFMD